MRLARRAPWPRLPRLQPPRQPRPLDRKAPCWAARARRLPAARLPYPRVCPRRPMARPACWTRPRAWPAKRSSPSRNWARWPARPCRQRARRARS
ncbi:hypothetical protein DY367_31320 [Achromobacter xylosoxidans]|uniref:Uncharacterized protein n=1 Tax=Alcaligenes xylosoxydans xylosoxydans TaxID=85698 RepID=A0A424W3B7_ALCXX|nr:hypothetical protein DY367_31320 [Achromobacter xylosoxidans]